ncbi:MAG: short chain dehydrogenase [Marinilabiliales bacterium]|nr:MAG: short chain dehydrogenase [Marinilabiliales bacterium]
MDFKGKKIWITGASSGIGEATSMKFAKLGAELIISSHEPEELERVCKACSDLGAKCTMIPFDLSKQDEVQSAANKVIEDFGAVDIFFSNGGVSQRAEVLDTPLHIDRFIMEVNYFSGITITKTLLPAMLKNGGGHIVATSSIAGDFGFRLRSAYSASKHAVYGFYETLRAEMKDKGIKATVVSPGRVKTNISVNAIDKQGKAHGKMDAGQDGGITAEKCADKIIKALKKNKPVAYIGGKELLMVYIKRFFPRIFFRIVSKIDPT